MEKAFKLKKADKQKWLKALRSGKYKKIQGIIGYGCNRCALGVAVAEKLCKASFGKYVPTSFLPSEIQKHISKMNDTGKSFKKIADYIEKNL